MLKGLFQKNDLVKSATSKRQVAVIASILSGFIYLFIFQKFGYDHIDLSLYTNRDDGLISFSHGVNWKDYGFIGVSPSGERVEGYSTPVHFFLYFIFYSLFHVGFDPYIKWQTIVCTFLLGYITFNFFKNKPLLGLIFTAICALLLSSAARFLEWHASGMENPLSEVFLLLTVYLLYRSIKHKDIKYYYSLAFATASLTRIESIYYVFPLLAIFLVIAWSSSYRKKAVITVLLTLFILVGIHSLRIWYFGSFQPNTSIGQNLDVKEQILKTVTLDRDYYSYCSLIGLKLIVYNNGWLLLIAFFLFYYSKKTPSNLFFVLSGFSLLLLTFFHAFIFKGERLDPIRYGAHLAPIAAVALLFPFANFKKLYNRHLIYLIPGVIVICIAFISVTRIQPENICCPVTAFEYYRSEFLKLKEDNQLVRPMLANPDLGIISYNKDFNMMDMANIGSPVMAKLSKSEILLNEYIFEVNSPDMVELHWPWSCMHTHLFADKRFNDKFKVVYEWGNQQCPLARSGIFFRKDIEINCASKERAFYEKFKNAIYASPLNKANLINCIASEVKSSNDTSIYASMHIVRTLYKFLPELRKEGLVEDVLREVNKLPTNEYATAYLTSYANPHWSDQAIAALVKYYVYSKFNSSLAKETNGSKLQTMPNSSFLKGEGGDYKVYYNNNVLLYCNPKYKKRAGYSFFLHVIPENIEDLPEAERQNGFHNLDYCFYDGTSGIVIDKQLYKPMILPTYKIKRIETGECNPTSALWVVAFDANKQ